MTICDFKPTDLDRAILDVVAEGWTLDRSKAEKRLCLTDGGAKALQSIASDGVECSYLFFNSYQETWPFFRKYRDLLRESLRDQVENGLFKEANGCVSAVLSFSCFQNRGRNMGDLEEAAAKALYANLYDAEGPVQPDYGMQEVAHAVVRGAVEDLASKYDWSEKEVVDDK